MQIAFFKKKLDFYKNLFDVIVERELPSYPLTKLAEDKIEKFVHSHKSASTQKDNANEIKLMLIHLIDNR